MVDDIFDTRFEDTDVDLDDNFIVLGDDFNLTEADPGLRNVLIGAGWDVNSFNTDALDLDLSLFLLGREGTTRKDEDFVFYNQPQTEGVKHRGDSRTGAGEGDDENISVDLHEVSYEVLRILIVLSVYKGFEKEQNLGMVRNAYLRIGNFDTRSELCRYKIDSVLRDQSATGVAIGMLDREGPKWHFRPAAEFVAGGLKEFAERYGLIINQE